MKMCVVTVPDNSHKIFPFTKYAFLLFFVKGKQSQRRRIFGRLIFGEFFGTIISPKSTQ